MMSSILASSSFFIFAVVLGALGAISIIAALVALSRARPLRFALRTLSGLLFLALGALIGTIALGMQGYRALTREELAAQISVRPTGPQRFEAAFRFPDGRKAVFSLAGDEIYVDAHILKWKPLGNLLGLHTVFELDRVAGRYRAIEQERAAVRTVYSLSEEKPVDLFGLRQRYAFLAPLFDAEYGSATFVPVTQPAKLQLLVSTTGLLIREANPGPK
ncbi:MAG TPA: hypothetical protein VLV32_05015 [Burkholderiales bacterium]|nr:hypothetical protein [Burkholderiales bacterium]